jgi:hypothetical protein
MRGKTRGKIDYSEIGEGRSKSIYIEPTVTDTAVLIAFYNPAGYRRILNNVRYLMKIMKEKKIPYFIIECVFNNRAQEIPEADMVVHSNSYMFYKEQLINKLEPIVPKQYTKLVALDADIVFDSPDWLDKISESLDKYDVIQPFLKACWLTEDNKRVFSCKNSYAYAFTKDYALDRKSLYTYHPGFAWAFRRDIFQRLGGFYSKAILGGGDTFFLFNFYGTTIPKFWLEEYNKGGNILVTNEWGEYNEQFQKVKPTLGYANLTVMHLFHGLMKNRKYGSRYDIFKPYEHMEWDELFITNEDDLTEFKNPRLRKLLLRYFKERNEDIPIEDARRHMTRKKKTD